MSEQIDWSKAPEGCIGAFTSKHDFRSVGFSSLFVITKRYSDYGAQAGCSGEDQDGKEYHVFEKYWDYHEKPALWSGEGLPPIGVKVLIMNPEQFSITDYGQEFVGEECTVRAAFVNDLDYRMVAVEKVGGACCCFISEMCFPIRTPEQIAADERDNAVDEMHKLYMEGAKHSGGLYALYDAGYRKP